jgi:gamma-glutamylcyclotransferase (GGCT)/AIG2-like uncharacterized protein YtfP
MSKIINPTIGTDPEFCAIDGNNIIRSVIDKIPGTKRKEHCIGNGCTIQVDNVNCEFTIPPVVTKNDFLRYINYCIKVGNEYLKEHGLRLSTMSSNTYTKEECEHPVAKKFGCEPSFDAFLKNMARVGNPKDKQLRSAGFHLHTGFIADNFTFDNIEKFIFCCDLFLGIPSLLIDGDTKRRSLYGTPSNFRYKKLENNLNIIEYRSLGGNLLYNEETIGYCFDQLQTAIKYYNENYENMEELISDMPMIRQAIMENDSKLAMQLINKYSINIIPYTVDKGKIIKNYVFVYGSLRPGEYNYSRFKEYYNDEINHVKKAEIKGYDLYSLGSYPGIVKGNNKLIGDILEVSNEVKNALDNMEFGAGYTEEFINIDGIECSIYVYEGGVNKNNLVKSGDWVKREVLV